MNATPLFSVLIAQYNNGKYLQEAIDSVKAQTYTHWEIIIVDDASTDNSKELYKLYENDERIKIYYNDENRGCGYTKRRCAELASGELCGFLDPDDALLPDAINTMLKEHLKKADISLIYSRYFVCDENLNQIQLCSDTKEIPADSDYLHTKGYAITHFVCFKRSFYNKTEGINPEYKRAIDQDLYLKLEEVGNVAFVDIPLYLYRIHAEGISLAKNEFKALYWYLKTIDAACERRKIANESECIIGDLLENRIRPQIERVEVLEKKIKQPTLKFILKLSYRYIFRK